jgi:uncharacterized protein YndB with AHSA1/START domain
VPATERVHLVHDFAKPVERVFAFLAEHENLPTIFAPATVVRLRDGTDGTRNGVGSVRRLRIPMLPPFEETNTKVVVNELIEYAITRGTPLRDHWGRMAFEPRGDGGTRLIWSIGMEAAIPGLAALVGKALKAKLQSGLRKVDEHA